MRRGRAALIDDIFHLSVVLIRVRFTQRTTLSPSGHTHRRAHRGDPPRHLRGQSGVGQGAPQALRQHGPGLDGGGRDGPPARCLCVWKMSLGCFWAVCVHGRMTIERNKHESNKSVCKESSSGKRPPARTCILFMLILFFRGPLPSSFATLLAHCLLFLGCSFYLFNSRYFTQNAHESQIPKERTTPPSRENASARQSPSLHLTVRGRAKRPGLPSEDTKGLPLTSK